MQRIDVIYPTCEKPTRTHYCAVKGCIFPRVCGDQCRHHDHFFDYELSMTDTMLDPADMYDEENPNRPWLYIATEEEIKNPDRSIWTTMAKVDKAEFYLAYLNGEL